MWEIYSVRLCVVCWLSVVKMFVVDALDCTILHANGWMGCVLDVSLRVGWRELFFGG